MFPPDILWIVTTQWRGSAGGWAGDGNASTPALDRLAKRGMNFPNAVTPHPFGPFARAAMLTGVRSPDNGVRDYFDPLPEESRTVSHVLAERGYATAWFGKWHLGGGDPKLPLVGEAAARRVVVASRRGGFGFWEGFDGGFLLNDPWLHGSELPEPTRFPGYQSDVVCERARRWLQGTPEKPPRFVVVSLEAPHPPSAAPVPPGIPVPDPSALHLAANVPRGGGTEARARRELSGYHAHIAATDRAIGRLLDQLRVETIVVFTSVHGDQHGGHGRFRKGWPYEESVRVPLLIGRAGESAPAVPLEIGGDVVSLLDLPVLTRAWAEGGTPRLGGEAREISMPSVVRLPDQCDRLWRGVRTRTRKLVLNGDGSPWMTFDLASDPDEQRNRASDPDWQGERAALATLLT